MALSNKDEIKEMVAGLLAQADPRGTMQHVGIAQRSRASIREIARDHSMRDHFRQFVRGTFNGRKLDELNGAEIGRVAAAMPEPVPDLAAVIPLRARRLESPEL